MDDELKLPIKSLDHVIKWSWEITAQTIIIYPLLQCLWLLNLAAWGYKMRSFLPQIYKTLWHMWSCNVTCYMSTTTRPMDIKLRKIPPIKSHKPLNTWSCKVTLQIKYISTTIMAMAAKRRRGTTWWRSSFHKVIKFLDHVVLQGHVTH